MIELLQAYLQSIILKNYGREVEITDFETPPKKELGDLAFGCFILSRELKRSPAQIASELQNIIDVDGLPLSFESSLAVGPYLNFYFSESYYSLELQRFLEDKNKFLFGDISQNIGKNIVIDYIGANVGKPLHIAHMCTPCQGQVFINLFQKLGYSVISDSHIGDWGIIFGKLLLAYKRYGDESKLEEDAVEHLFELYVHISKDAEENPELEDDFRATFKMLSQGNPESVELWKKFTSFSIDGMRKSLARLQVRPLFDIGESFYEGIGLPKIQDYPDLTVPMYEIVEELLEKGIATKNEDNSVGVVFPEVSKIPSCILQKRDGTHGYLASDLTAIKYRIENWSPDKILYFVDVRQQLHFKQAFCIAKLAGWISSDFEIDHAYNGFISLKDGAMSTRKGKIIKLDALFNEASERAKKILLEKRDDISGEALNKLSEIIGIGAIKYGYLKKSRESDVIFDWDEFMSFEGNSGPYIQYSYVRAKKILEKVIGVDIQLQEFSVTQKEEKELLSHLWTFPQVIRSMQEGYHAHVLCQYIYDASKLFSSLYANLPILQEDDTQKKYTRIKILESYIFILETTFGDILAIPLPQEM